MASKREFTLEKEHQYNRSGPSRWIVAHAARYPLLPLVVLVMAIINNLCVSFVQVFIGRAFDLITSANFTTAALATIAVSIILVTIGQGLTGVLRTGAVEFLAQRIERDSREEFYVSLLGKSQTFHSRQRVGDIMARATNDVRSLNYMFSPGLGLIIDSAMGILMPILLISRISPSLMLVPSIFLVLLGVTIWDYNRRLGPVSEALRGQFGKMNAGLEEAVAGIEVVKANVQEHYQWHKFIGDARVFRDYYVRLGTIQAVYLPALVFGLAWGAGLLDALLIWRSGAITLGQVVTFMGLMGVLRFPTYISVFTFNLVQMGMAGARRILQIINTETELDENQAGIAQPIRGEVTFEHVSFGYGDKCILQDISFSAKAGETVAIVGLTGSGKTTLTRLINRIFDLDGGRVLVDGIDVRDWSLESLRSQISTIEQDVFLFSNSLAENIAFGRAGAGQDEIDAAARAAQAHDFITGFAEGYQTEVGERGVTLSGGQRQRIAIARAFLTDPRILILDDSTSAIDSATEDQIQRAMQHISRERTTFLITHRLSQIRWADRILLLKRGALIEQGTHEELLARSPDYQRIFVR